jgi:hypothetical protein
MLVFMLQCVKRVCSHLSSKLHRGVVKQSSIPLSIYKTFQVHPSFLVVLLAHVHRTEASRVRGVVPHYDGVPEYDLGMLDLDGR